MIDWLYDHEGVFFALVVVVAFALIAAIGFGSDAYNCSQIEQITGRYTEWHPIPGCFVEVNGELIPLTAWYEITNG